MKGDIRWCEGRFNEEATIAYPQGADLCPQWSNITFVFFHILNLVLSNSCWGREISTNYFNWMNFPTDFYINKCSRFLVLHCFLYKNSWHLKCTVNQFTSPVFMILHIEAAGSCVRYLILSPSMFPYQQVAILHSTVCQNKTGKEHLITYMYLHWFKINFTSPILVLKLENHLTLILLVHCIENWWKLWACYN